MALRCCCRRRVCRCIAALCVLLYLCSALFAATAAEKRATNAAASGSSTTIRRALHGVPLPLWPRPRRSASAASTEPAARFTFRGVAVVFLPSTRVLRDRLTLPVAEIITHALLRRPLRRRRARFDFSGPILSVASASAAQARGTFVIAPRCPTSPLVLCIEIEVEDSALDPTVAPTNEAYSASGGMLGSLDTTVSVVGRTWLGVLHGLRSIAQLVEVGVHDNLNIVNRNRSTTTSANDDDDALWTLPQWPFTIADRPRFAVRGLLLDVAHHPHDAAWLKNILFFASLLGKMNLVQLHLTDHQGFGVQFSSRPAMGLPSQKRTLLTALELGELETWARRRGITLVPEIDVPGHALGFATQGVAARDSLVAWTCKDNRAGSSDVLPTRPLCNGNLDPLHPETFDVLNDLVREAARTFSSSWLHLGGDETHFKSYRARLARIAEGAERSALERTLHEAGVQKVDPEYGALDLPHQLLELFERRLLQRVVAPLLRERGAAEEEEARTHSGARNANLYHRPLRVVRWEEAMKPNLASCCFDPITAAHGNGSVAIHFWKRGNRKRGRTAIDAVRRGFSVLASPETHWYLDPQPMFRKRWTERWRLDPLVWLGLDGASESEVAMCEGGLGACWGQCMASVQRQLFLPLLAIAERLWSRRLGKADSEWKGGDAERTARARLLRAARFAREVGWRFPELAEYE